jgi:uncharacterized protein (TIGR02452 family)
MSRGDRAQQGQEAVRIAERACYRTTGGAEIQLGPAMDRCLTGTTLHRPEELERLLVEGPDSAGQSPRTQSLHKTRFTIANETTLAAAERMVVRNRYAKVLALNFASARNPGGGFLGGSQAQEESLARSSGLYRSLLTQPAYYEANRACDSALYTDHMIVSPDVPVFRDDTGALLDEPYFLSIVTAPAVNAGALLKNSPHLAPQILPTMKSRVEKLLALAAHLNYEHLLLGAWGCGVFRNEPESIGSLFASALLKDDRFRGRFRSVHFAVLDRTEGREIIRPFEQRFAHVPA